MDVDKPDSSLRKLELMNLVVIQRFSATYTSLKELNTQRMRFCMLRDDRNFATTLSDTGGFSISLMAIVWGHYSSVPQYLMTYSFLTMMGERTSPWV